MSDKDYTDQIDTFSAEYELVTRAQQGEHPAFEELYKRYNERIVRHITRIVNDSGVGNELTQEAFLKVWEMLPRLRNPACFVSWLYRIATNKTYNYQKHTRLLRHVSWEENISEITASTASDLEQQIEESELVRFVLARMKPTYRSCLLLYFVDKLPRLEISQCLGIKLSSVDKYISRSKKEFRQLYEHVLDKNTEKQAEGDWQS